MDVYDFIRNIKSQGLMKVKHCIVLESVYIYVKDGNVYKFILHVNPDMLKKAKKLGLDGEYISYHPGNIKLKLEEKYRKGSFIIIYDLSKNEANVYDGEVSEQEQIEKLKCKRIPIVNDKA